MRTVVCEPGSERRDTIRVANRVQSVLPTAKGIPVKLWRSDDLPTDCPPTMTSWLFGQDRLKTQEGYLK